MGETKVKVIFEAQKSKVDPKIKKDVKEVKVKKIRIFRQALPL